MTSDIRQLFVACTAVAILLAAGTQVQAQMGGPLDRVAVQPVVTPKSIYRGPLDRPARPQQPTMTPTTYRGALGQYSQTMTPTLAQPSKRPVSVPAKVSKLPAVPQQAGTQFQTQGTFKAFAFPELYAAENVTSDANLVQSSLNVEEDIARPEFEEELPTTDNQPERPGFEVDVKSVTPQNAVGSSVQQSGQSTTEFSGTFSDFQAMTEAANNPVIQSSQDWPGHQEMDPGYQPSPMDYQMHGIVGYDVTPGSIDPGYVDGASFGFDRNRLYHPLETPTTQFVGTPSIPTNFGVCDPCDPWDGFCRMQNLEYFTKCGGLKATPGHYGIPWLTSDDACEEVGLSFWQRLKMSCRTCDGAACGQCDSAAADCGCNQ